MNPPGRPVMRGHAWVSLPMVTAGFTPMVVTALVSLAGVRLSEAVWFGLGWAGLIVALLTWVGLSRTGLPPHHRVAVIVLSGAIGAVLIAAKLALH